MPITLTQNMRAFVHLVRKSREIGWPEIYRDDLFKHDKEELAKRPDGQFAWLVRATGTWLFWPSDHCDNHILRYVEQFESDADIHRAFWWDGKSLTEIPVKEVRRNLFIAVCSTGEPKTARCQAHRGRDNMVEVIETQEPVGTPPDPDGDKSRWRERPCFYVTAIYEGQYATLAGPFPTHKQSLDKVRAAMECIYSRDYRAPWYSYGTAKFADGKNTGQFNMAVGVNLDAITAAYVKEGK